MTPLHVIAGPGAGEVVTGLALLGTTYDVRVSRAMDPADLPGDVQGHVLIATSVPEGVAAAVTAWPAERIHGLVLLADSTEPGGLVAHLDAVAAWRAPTLVVAPAEGVLRQAGQLLSAGVPDAVFVVTEESASHPEATTVQWLGSFLSIVDGLRAEVMVR